jgi:bifunctional UDP-N-acetylglucosamine pyrophosphorylase/glucosamine-1-phosphate N-acetyltransferase
VQIESGAIIYPNNIIKGQSYIGKNVVLESGNYIVDSAICDGAKVCQSYIKNSVVEKKKNIGPFENLTNVKV